MIRKVVIYTLTLLFLSSFLLLSSCSIIHPSPQRKVEKKQAKAEKQANKEYEKIKEQHYDLQKKETKKMMKKTKKRAKVVNQSKKRGFFSSKRCK